MPSVFGRQVARVHREPRECAQLSRGEVRIQWSAGSVSPASTSGGTLDESNSGKRCGREGSRAAGRIGAGSWQDRGRLLRDRGTAAAAGTGG